MIVFQVALGAALGGVLRFLCLSLFRFAYGTAFVNVLGSFLIGVAFVALASKGEGRWQPFVMTGILGGFTTFAAFSLDMVRLIESDRLVFAFLYGSGSALLSIIACFAGIWLGRSVF